MKSIAVRLGSTIHRRVLGTSHSDFVLFDFLMDTTSAGNFMCGVHELASCRQKGNGNHPCFDVVLYKCLPLCFAHHRCENYMGYQKYLLYRCRPTKTLWLALESPGYHPYPNNAAEERHECFISVHIPKVPSRSLGCNLQCHCPFPLR